MGENIPKYEVHYDVFRDVVSVVYDGVSYKTSEITNIHFDKYTMKWWKERHPNQEYPWRIPEKSEYYIAVNPHGSGDRSIHDARISLERYLEALRKKTSPSHPFTVRDIDRWNHPDYYEECEDRYESDDSEYDTMGWENVDDAEIVLVKASWAMTPVYAIRFKDPVKLRPVNADIEKYDRVYRDVMEAVGAIGSLLETMEDFGLASRLGDEEFKGFYRYLVSLQDEYEEKLSKEKAIGRKGEL